MSLVAVRETQYRRTPLDNFDVNVHVILLLVFGDTVLPEILGNSIITDRMTAAFAENFMDKNDHMHHDQN